MITEPLILIQILPKNLNVKHNTGISVYSQILIFEPTWELEFTSVIQGFET